MMRVYQFLSFILTDNLSQIIFFARDSDENKLPHHKSFKEFNIAIDGTVLMVSYHNDDGDFIMVMLS